MEGSRASSTGLAGHVAHAASIWVGAGSISFSCSRNELPTSFSGPMKPQAPGPSATWSSGMAGRWRARTMGSRRGLRTTRPLDGPTSTNASSGNATRDGRHVSWNKPVGMIAERRLLFRRKLDTVDDLAARSASNLWANPLYSSGNCGDRPQDPPSAPLTSPVRSSRSSQRPSAEVEGFRKEVVRGASWVEDRSSSFRSREPHYAQVS